MAENNQSNLIQRAIDEQDMLSYFAFAHIDELLFFEEIDSEFKFSYSKFSDFLAEHPEVIENLSMSNLVFALDGHNADAVKLAEEQIMKRFKNGEHLFGRNGEYQFMGPPREARNVVFSKLSPENIETVKQAIDSNLKSLETADSRSYNLVKNFHYYASIDNFLDSFEKGYITPEKLDYLERLAIKNPNILDKMDFSLLEDNIFSMGEDFITRVAKYPNMSTKLIGLQKVNPELFETVKKGIMALEQETRKPEALELEQAGLTYAFRNYKTAQDLSFEEILNRGIRETKPISVKTEEGFTLIDPKEGTDSPLEAIHKGYDIKEKYTKTLVDKLAETAETARKSEDVEYIEKDEKKVKQIRLHGNFSILAHSTDSGFKEDKTILDNDFKKTWEHQKDVASHLVSSCYMDQDFLGHVPAGKNGVLMVFSDLETDDISLMGPKDINTHIRSYDSHAGEATYMNADELTQNSRRIYAEVPVERRQPNFLLVFDDTPEEVLQNTYKSALDFDIPVLYVDKREVEKNQLDNLDKMIEEFKRTADVSILPKLVSTYETNVAGWLLNRDTSQKDESLTAEVGNERFREDFEARGQELSILIQDYITIIEASNDVSKRKDLSVISKTMKAELDKYELANKNNNLLSKTAPSLDYKGILERVKNLDLDLGEASAPTATQKVDIASIALNAVEQESVGLSDLQALRTNNKEKQITESKDTTEVTTQENPNENKKHDTLESQGEDR